LTAPRSRQLENRTGRCRACARRALRRADRRRPAAGDAGEMIEHDDGWRDNAERTVTAIVGRFFVGYPCGLALHICTPSVTRQAAPGDIWRIVRDMDAAIWLIMRAPARRDGGAPGRIPRPPPGASVPASRADPRNPARESVRASVSRPSHGRAPGNSRATKTPGLHDSPEPDKPNTGPVTARAYWSPQPARHASG